MGHLLFDSIEAFQTSFGPHAEAIIKAGNPAVFDAKAEDHRNFNGELPVCRIRADPFSHCGSRSIEGQLGFGPHFFNFFPHSSNGLGKVRLMGLAAEV